MTQNEHPSRAGAAVEFDRVTIDIGGAPILDSVTAIVPVGSTTAIIGPNGAGKTTLLMALLGQTPYGGSIRFTSPRPGQATRIGYVPQGFGYDRGMPLTVLEFMAMGRQRSPVWFGARKRFRRDALDLLASLGAEHLAQRQLGALSGGELQRALLALALQRDPDLLVLDEPAAGMDIMGEHILCELLESLQRERGFTQIMVSHDLATVTAHATHVICLNRRVIVQGQPENVLRPEVLLATFGLHLGLPALEGLPASTRGRVPDLPHKERPDA